MVRSNKPGAAIPEWKEKMRRANQERNGSGNGNSDTAQGQFNRPLFQFEPLNPQMTGQDSSSSSWPTSTEEYLRQVHQPIHNQTLVQTPPQGFEVEEANPIQNNAQGQQFNRPLFQFEPLNPQMTGQDSSSSSWPTSTEEYLRQVHQPIHNQTFGQIPPQGFEVEEANPIQSAIDPNATLPPYLYLDSNGQPQEWQPYSASSLPPPYRPSTCSYHDYGYGTCQCMDDCRPGVGWTWNSFDNSWMPPFDDSPDCIAFREAYEMERIAREKWATIWQEEQLLIARIRRAKEAKALDKANAREFKERRKKERELQKIKDEEELEAKFKKAGFRIVGDIFEAKKLIEERRLQLLAQFYWNCEKKKEIFEERKKDVRLLMDELLTEVEENVEPVRLLVDELVMKVEDMVDGGNQGE